MNWCKLGLHKWVYPKQVTLVFSISPFVNIRRCCKCGICQGQIIGHWHGIWRYDYNQMVKQAGKMWKQGFRWVGKELLNINSPRTKAILR